MRVIPERWRGRSRRDTEGTMSLVEHLEELRHRVVVSTIAVGLGAALGFALFDAVIELLRAPYCDTLANLPPANRPETGCRFVFLGLVDPVVIKLKVAAFVGLFLALPVVLYQLWAFIVPGLHRRERRLAIPFVLTSVGLFVLGALFAYWTLPRALSFLIGFAGPAFVPIITGDRFLGFMMMMALAFGLSFEFPIVLVFLNSAGVVSVQQLRDARRWAILAIVVFAAVITPSGDPYTLLAMSLPMVVFYEAAIIVGRVMKR
jgi:sec-independent protein translocase protein TatC